MNLTKSSFKQFVFLNRAINGGDQIVLKFDNGFGASVVRGPFTYGGDKGLYELGVIKFNESGDNFGLTYDTPITEDVIGYLSEQECFDYFKQIMALCNPNTNGK